LKKNKYNLAFFVLLTLTISACSSQEQAQYSTGEEVYQARCSSCHGGDLSGRVGPALNAESSAASMPDSYWVQTITKGKGSMPAQRLTDNEVTMVIEYIRSNH
jgi:mono/diheme cytochrome c family protein